MDGSLNESVDNDSKEDHGNKCHPLNMVSNTKNYCFDGDESADKDGCIFNITPVPLNMWFLLMEVFMAHQICILGLAESVRY